MSSAENGGITEYEQTMTEKKTTQRYQKIVYSREFLLSCARLDVCRSLPEGLELSLLRELDLCQNDILEPWNESSLLCLPESGRDRGILQSTRSQSRFSADININGHSTWLIKGRNTQALLELDTGRYGVPSQPSLDMSRCKSEVMGQAYMPDSEKSASFCLNKCENPYRPPHTYKVGSTTSEAKANSEKTSCLQERSSANEVLTPSKQDKLDVVSDDMRYRSEEVTVAFAAPVNDVTPSCLASNFQPSLENVNMSMCRGKSNEGHPDMVNDKPAANAEAAQQQEVIYFGSVKSNVSTCADVLNEKHSRKHTKEASESNSVASIVIETAFPQHLAAKGGSENKSLEELSSPRINCSINMQNKSPEGSAENPEVGQSNKPTSDTYLKDSYYDRGQRGLHSGNARIDISKPYEFLIPIGYDFFASVFHEKTSTWINQSTFSSADEWKKSGMYEMDDDQLDFDDMWSDILVVIRLDQRMELYLAAENDETAEFGIHCPLNKESLISNDHPSTTKQSALVPADCNHGSIGTDDEIHLPDEDSLITVEDVVRPYFSESMDSNIFESVMNSYRSKVEKQPGTSVVTDHDKGSAIPVQNVPPVPSVTASAAYSDFCHSHAAQPNLCASSIPGMPSLQPTLSLESQILLPGTCLAPISTYQYPGLYQHCCTNMLHEPAWKTSKAKSKERNRLYCYSVSQQPPILSPQNRRLLLYGASTDLVKELAFTDSELDWFRRFFADKNQQVSGGGRRGEEDLN